MEAVSKNEICTLLEIGDYVIDVYDYTETYDCEGLAVNG